ncbi:MAG: hypothetical protein MOGMAGMI_01635 [Candidatus Omnitrophica bacterium]|nr:hypothetical protein [Candidatus Omnitrophota bacterium]
MRYNVPMLFNSWTFAVFYVVVYALYTRLRHEGQNRLLLAASYVFYGSWDWRFLGFILLSTVVDYAAGIAIRDNTSVRLRRLWLWGSIGVNLGILGYFKYCGFFVESMASLLETLGIPHSLPSLRLLLPAGISFYTFQSLSYTIDVYRGEMEPERRFPRFALFVSYFPHLVAGPIVRARVLLTQIGRERTVTPEGVLLGCRLFLWGLLKKVVIADRLALYVEAVYGNPADHTGLSHLAATVCFGFQIYCDFSAYSDMARGVSKTMGFELPLNFNAPYLASDIVDFWRRWHISLSTWLRDYVYIPLGGNRHGGRRTAINLMLTMLLGGLWHGAAWTYVIWGGLHGLYLVVAKQYMRLVPRRPGTLLRGVYGLTTFAAVMVAWVFFRAESLQGALTALARMARPGTVLWDGERTLLYGALGVGVLLACERWALDPSEGDVLTSRRPAVRWAAAYAIALAVMLFGVHQGQQFIYFQF